MLIWLGWSQGFGKWQDYDDRFNKHYLADYIDGGAHAMQEHKNRLVYGLEFGRGDKGSDKIERVVCARPYGIETCMLIVI